MDHGDIDMPDSDAADEANCSTNVNKPINLDDTEFQCHDEYSQDLFDDTESSVANSPCINFDISQITTVNSPRITDLTSLTQTPKFGNKESSPCHPTIPTIPRSLLPFISTVNESWNSDLETPQAKTAAEMSLQCAERIEQLSKSCESMERRGVIPGVTTPSGCFVARVENEDISSSPILNTMIKRRRPKRRILKSFIDNKEVTNIRQTYADENVTKEIENLGSLTRNDTTFVIDENCSLHNSNIHLVKDEINDQDSTLIENDEECLMKERLQGCEESEEINSSKVMMDYADVEYSVNKTPEKSLAELVEEIEELQENNEQVVEHKYADIPMDVFTRDAKALENAKMIPTKPLNITSLKKQRGLISFTEMCLLEQENSANEDSGIKETVETDSPIINHEFSHHLQEDKLTTTKSDALSSKENKDIVDIFSSSFSERDGPVIDIDEFSPWFYQSNETKSEFSNNLENLATEYSKGKINASETATKQKNGLGKEKELAAKNNKLHNCSSGYTTSKGKIKDKTEPCLEETAKDGKNNYEKTSPKGTASSNYRVDNKEKIRTDSIQFHSSIGFSTAGGKPITISEEKIKKAAKLYNEISLQDGIHYDAKISHDKTGNPRANNSENNSYSSMGFSTAGGKPIKISEDKLKTAEKLYEEIALQDQKQYNAKMLQEVPEDQLMKDKENEATIHQNSHCSLGFSTASGNPIKISKDKLQKAVKSYEEIALQDTEQFDAKVLDGVSEDHKAKRRENETTVQNSYCSVGFSTASGKPIKINEDKLKETEKLYNETSLTDNLQLPNPSKVPIPRGIKRKYEFDSQTDSNSICDAESSVGFKTACGKPLIISETAIKKAKMIYQSIDISESQFLQGNELTKEPMTSVDMEQNKSIIKNYNETHGADIKSSFLRRHEEIEESFVIKSEDTLNNEDSYKLQRFPGTAYQKTNTNTESEQTEQLASGSFPKVITGDNLSNELRKTANAKDQSSKIVIQQDQTLGKHHSIDHTINTRISIPMTSISSGFSTASGKAIKISDQALSNARNLLVEDENSLQSSPSIKTINKDGFARFSTGNGEVIKISEDALLKAKKLLATGQENTPPAKSVLKRNSNEMETPESSKAPVVCTPVLKSLSENILSEDTPLGVSILQTSKRVRFNSELQARKLFSEKGSDSDEEIDYPDKLYRGYEKGSRTPLNNSSNYALHLLSHERNKNVSFFRNNTPGLFAKSEMFEITDRLMVPKLEAQKSCPLNQEADTMQFAEKSNNDNMRSNQALKDRRVSAYSDEITASTEALLADEENSLDGKSWTSAITCSPILLEDRNIPAKPMTLGVEIPTSPIIGAKFRSLRKNKRSKKNMINKDATSLNEVSEEQFAAQDSQQSSGVATPSSSSSKESHRSTSTLIETALLSKLEKLEATSSRVQFCDNQFENSEEVASSEMDDREAIDYFSENHIAATLKQEKEIRAKKKYKPRPIPGGLLRRKMANKESRVSWRQATNGVPPRPRTVNELISTGIALDVMEVTAASALDYRFKCVDFYSKDEILANSYGLETGDGSRLIFNGNGYAGVAEFEQAFIASPGVDPSLVPLRWVENHYRWIVWKLASMDRMKFGDLIMPRMLTPHNVLEQLKYRYDREIDKSQRPALRRIIEKDDPPNRRMVLCVATITKPENIQTLDKSPGMSPTSHWKVEITDGWYSITATIDSAMSHLIAFGKVREGTKLVTCRAELLNCEQGCFPLEIPGEASLKIHTNSTRRAKWDTKLGYCRYLGPVPTSLPSIHPNGGLIGKLDVIIARVYPIQYFEKTYSGQSVFRNSKCEDKAVMIYEKERQAQIDSIYSKSRAEFEARHRKISKKKSPTICSKSLEFSSQSQETGKKLCRNEWNDGDLESDEQSYGDTLEEAFRVEVESKLRENLPPPRKVTLLLRVRVMEGDNLAIITFWSPSEDIIDIIKEGNRVSMHNVQTSGRRSGELQLTTSRKSFVKPEESNVPSFPRRCLTTIPEVAVAGFNPPFGEFDTVGIVVSLGPAPHGMKNFEVVNLAYPNPDQSDSAYLSILFWEGIGAHGFSDILSIGAIVACTNLQWRRGAPRTIPMAYSTEHSTFTRNPRQIYLRSAFDSVKSQITDPVSYVSQCAVEIALEHQKKSTILRSPAVQGTPSKASPSMASIQDKFGPSVSPRTPQSLVNAGEITPAKYSIQRRLEKLQWYGEPPELSPIALNHSSMKVNQKFVPPARTPENLEYVNQRRDSSLKK